MIFTFWEGKMPAYIKMCLDTWKFPFVILNYDNLWEYTHLPIDKLKRFWLAQISDCVRVHVLRDNGGYWLDADTIMLSDRLPEETIMGYPETRINTCGYLHTEPHMQMFEEWAAYQDKIINGPDGKRYWGTFANEFSDQYLNNHLEVPIGDVERCWPETYLVDGDAPRMQKYKYFYFEQSYKLSDIKETDMIMLHNSWTPKWYKDLSEEDVLASQCTLSNILKVLL